MGAYKAIYYPSLYTDIETWTHRSDCVCISSSTEIIDILPYRTFKKEYPNMPILEKEGVHIPAFINAHSHIDNAYLANKTTGGKGFYQWLLSVLHYREEEAYIQNYLHEYASRLLDEIEDTALIASIASFPFIRTFLSHLHIPHYLFYESIGATSLVPEEDTIAFPFSYASYAGHALYSTHASVLQQIKQHCLQYKLPFSMHLAEHEEELDFLHGKENAFTALLQSRLMHSYSPPYKSPVAYAYSLGLLDSFSLAVHCVHLSSHDIELLQESKATVCLCPRSNTFIGVGIAEAQKLYNHNIPLCIATDGVASNSSLSLWEEIRYAMLVYGFTLQQIIPMVTTSPARILGISNYFGKIQKGFYPKTTCIPSDLQDYL